MATTLEGSWVCYKDSGKPCTLTFMQVNWLQQMAEILQQREGNEAMNSNSKACIEWANTIRTIVIKKLHAKTSRW